MTSHRNRSVYHYVSFVSLWRGAYRIFIVYYRCYIYLLLQRFSVLTSRDAINFYATLDSRVVHLSFYIYLQLISTRLTASAASSSESPQFNEVWSPSIFADVVSHRCHMLVIRCSVLSFYFLSVVFFFRLSCIRILRNCCASRKPCLFR